MIGFEEAKTHLEIYIRRLKIEAVAGLRILDLACGSRLYRLRDGDEWPPTFTLLCAREGSKVVAVDQYPQDPRDCEPRIDFVHADIVESVRDGQLVRLPELRDGGFTIIHSAAFVGNFPDPRLGLNMRERIEFEQQLHDQLMPLLAPGGIMYLGQIDKRDKRIIYRA